jgi:hypothetical protein
MQSPRVQSAYHKAACLFVPEFAAEVREHADRHEKLLRRACIRDETRVGGVTKCPSRS